LISGRTASSLPCIVTRVIEYVECKKLVLSYGVKQVKGQESPAITASEKSLPSWTVFPRPAIYQASPLTRALLTTNPLGMATGIRLEFDPIPSVPFSHRPADLRQINSPGTPMIRCSTQPKVYSSTAPQGPDGDPTGRRTIVVNLRMVCHPIPLDAMTS